MKILLVGGGSGGHITPLLAVAHKLRAAVPEATISYVLEKGSRFANLPQKSTDLNGVYQIRAGKFRRYHSQSLIAHVLDVPTNLKNLRDLFYVIAGICQSWRLLGRLRPDVVFIKGGFVGLPVGLACRLRRISYFTHDSDTVPGLANRVIAKHATYHAVGMPAEFYSYPKAKMRYTGIPLSAAYTKVDAVAKQQYRSQLKLPNDSLVLSVTGGSLGATGLNTAVRAVAEDLLADMPQLHIVHQTGSEKLLYDDLPDEYRDRVREMTYSDELYAVTGAADVVVTRAGATTIAELAVQAKACVLVPGSHLTGGQQDHNAAYLHKHQAAVVVPETEASDPVAFRKTLGSVLSSSSKQQALATALGSLAKPEADEALTAIILELASKHKQ